MFRAHARANALIRRRVTSVTGAAMPGNRQRVRGQVCRVDVGAMRALRSARNSLRRRPRMSVSLFARLADALASDWQSIARPSIAA